MDRRRSIDEERTEKEVRCVEVNMQAVIGDHAGGFFELLHLNGAYRKDDGIRILVGGHGTSEEAAIADAVFKTLQKLLTISPDKVPLPLQVFPGGADAITHIRAAASSANLKLFEKLRDEGLFSFTEEMTPLLQLDLLSLAPRWRQASRNSSKRAGFDDSSETDDEKEQRIARVVDMLTRFCRESRNGMFRPHEATAAQKEFLIANVLPYTLKSIIENHRVFDLHQEENDFRWGVSLTWSLTWFRRSVETQIITDITAIAPSFATSSRHFQENAYSSNEVCVDGNRNQTSRPLASARDDEVASTESESSPPETALDVDEDAETMSPSLGPDEVVDDSWWNEEYYDWTHGVPLGRCRCGLRIPHWDEACWLCTEDPYFPVALRTHHQLSH